MKFLKEKILLEAMFEVPESDIICVKIDEDVLSGKKTIEYVRKKKDEQGEKVNAESEIKSVENNVSTDSADDERKVKNFA